MPFTDTAPSGKPDQDDDRKKIVTTIVEKYRSDPLVLGELRQIFPDYEDGILSVRPPNPRLKNDEIAEHVGAIDDGVNAYIIDRDKTRPSILRKLSVGRQALLFDNWGYVTNIIHHRAYDTAKQAVADFGQNAIVALSDAIANFKDRKHPDTFRNYIGRAATNNMISGIRKLYRTPETPEESIEMDTSDEELQRSIRAEAAARQLREILANAEVPPADITLLCLRFGINPYSLGFSDTLEDTQRGEILHNMPDRGYDSKSLARIVGRKSSGAVRVAQNGIIKAIRDANDISPKKL